MKTIENRGGDVDRRALTEAVEALREGKIIIYPTDTLYALGCNALDARAIERLCRIKGLNPDKNTLSIVCCSLSQAAEYARIDNRAFRILKEYLPGPFTFILPASTTLPKVFKGRKNVGVRIPANAFATALAEELGNPVLTSSAEAEDADDVVNAAALALHYAGYKDIELAVESGEGSHEPSTVVDLTDSTAPEILRQGQGEFID
ncbi:MAG: threonylcarbamoyl-AMP synthase [Muribaculaceae bacterium]|nr:threonylcarbamoyl-AMP synthase [Muribaculaceae bacterium]